ncbi:NAD(P)/FAD-dependent oxidoreductase [Algoriphagus limi]|uniref:NAD(P)/FAD-dependent oxidoreductase n=1 Tax=Algoriphagus limi TaxID=2975273 RepID=A0ABT2G7E3_9BACT|nr:NAD(P)/FAD-dependent oxidoreductase [Algoriphagus limi]MCS5491184.1 NAD(P)/FAD-dependent oxidoreductase [Algoriphagus limi]
MGKKRDIIVIGGGLAGLVSAYLLAKNGHSVRLIEKKVYPFHRVCGEYLSNEVVNFLNREKLLPPGFAFPQINRFEFSDIKGKAVQTPLDLGGFGISRFLLDDHISMRAQEMGAEILTGTQVLEVNFLSESDRFQVELEGGNELESDYVIGAFGKRSRIDSFLNRPFTQKRSPFIGVKYHIKIDRPNQVVALHNFPRGYCGLNAVEEGKFNLCYLGRREHLREFGSIPEMEQQVLWRNPKLAQIFNEGEFLFEKPEVINEISFEKKSPVENHLLMVGDSAGLITPLNGNGMAMAIRGAFLLANIFENFENRNQIENQYSKEWNLHFKNRLLFGRWIQKLFGAETSSSFARNLLANFPWLSQQIIRNTHGEPF